MPLKGVKAAKKKPPSNGRQGVSALGIHGMATLEGDHPWKCSELGIGQLWTQPGGAVLWRPSDQPPAGTGVMARKAVQAG